jgi:hypothetical protein
MRPENLAALQRIIDDEIATGDLVDRVAALNEARALLHAASPFAGEPVDYVRWVPNETVQGNAYNPNVVAPPEMELLRLSIVVELRRRNWSNEKIGKQLGMDADEVLRLCQMTGLAELFADDDFSASWDIDDLSVSDEEALAEVAALTEGM